MIKETLYSSSGLVVWLRVPLLLALICGAAFVAKADAPILLTQPNSTRAVALDALTKMREPFPLFTSSLLSTSTDKRTRIMLFAMNITTSAPTTLTVDAEDEKHRHYNLKVEYAGPLIGMEALGVSHVIVRLSDDIGNVGDVLLQLKFEGQVSNRVRIGIGFVGGGLPDDMVRLSGRVAASDNTGIPGAIVNLSGFQSSSTVTDADGNYSFLNLNPNAGYSVSVSKANYAFTPLSRSFANLYSNPTANFTGALASYAIKGQILDGSKPLSAITVNLSGSQSLSTTTDAGGNYSFSVPAEGNYLITPTSALYTFSPSSAFYSNLSANQTLNFVTATRPSYSISGNIKKADGSGLAGVTLTLSGSKSATVATDATGFYAFANLDAGGNYAVTASREGYSFNPVGQSFNSLDKNQTLNFAATIGVYSIKGRITNSDGAGVPQVLMTLSGSQSGTTLTDINGNYSFNVNYGGTYMVTPSSEYNSFTPAARTFDNLGGDRTADFNAIAFNGFYVLEFSGGAQTVDYGDFFQPPPGKSQLGKFFWEFWAMPGTDALSRYMLSDGYGGAHALLFGFIGDNAGTRLSLYGNVWNGSTQIDFGSDDGPAPNEWGHMAVGWDGNYIYTYFNGIPVGLKPFSGPRMPGGVNNGAGTLFIGGSDHSNFMGRIAQVRGFEEVNPRDNGLQTVTFRPDLVFGLNFNDRTTNPRSTLLSRFFSPAITVQDLAGGRMGTIRGTGFGAASPLSTFPLPKFVIDPAAPNTSPVTGPVTPEGKIDAPAEVPKDAIIFDSFSRRSSTYAFGGRGGLGFTEGGSAGIKEWKVAATGAASNGSFFSAFGILNGQAVVLSDSPYGCLAWVETGATTGYLFTGVSRNPRFYKTGIDTGVAFRVADSSNYFFAFTYGDPVNEKARKLIIGYWLNSQITYVAKDVVMPASWTKLQVVSTANGKIEVYADTTLVYTTTSSVLADKTGAGLFNFSGEYALANRWDNFVVYDRP